MAVTVQHLQRPVLSHGRQFIYASCLWQPTKWTPSPPSHPFAPRVVLIGVSDGVGGVGTNLVNNIVVRNLTAAATFDEAGNFESLRIAVTKLQQEMTDFRKEVTNLRQDINDVRKELANLRQDFNDFRKEVTTEFTKLRKDLGRIERAVGSLVEDSTRKKVADMFGNSFAKPFVVESLHDALHILSKTGHGTLHPAAMKGRFVTAERLAEKGQKYAVVLVGLFRDHVLQSCNVEESTCKAIAQAFATKDYKNGLEMLVGVAKSSPGLVSPSVARKMEKLQLAFGTTGMPTKEQLLMPDGPGVMLLELAARDEAGEDIRDMGRLQSSISEAPMTLLVHTQL